MIRLAWRLGRLPAAATAALLSAVALALLVTGHEMASYVRGSGLAACLAVGGDCSEAANQFTGRFGSLLGDVAWLGFVPMLVGLFWGAPLVARELEQGTHRLVWTQSISRTRWLLTKLCLNLLAALAMAAITTQLFTWWYRPFEGINAGGAGNSFSRMNPNVFDFHGTVLIGYVLFAFALGAATGTIIGRTLPAMAVTVVGYLTLRLIMQSLRGHLIPPKSITYPLGAVDPRARLGDWTLSSQTIDLRGHSLTYAQLVDACSATTGSGLNRVCLAAHGIRTQDLYQPLSRFWALQGIETSVFVTAAILFLGIAAWWTICHNN